MCSSRILCLLLSVFLCCSSVLFPAAAAGNYWTLDDLEADPFQELEDIKGAGPAAPAVMSIDELENESLDEQSMMFSMNGGVEVAAEESDTLEFRFVEHVPVVFGSSPGLRYDYLMIVDTPYTGRIEQAMVEFGDVGITMDPYIGSSGSLNFHSTAGSFTVPENTDVAFYDDISASWPFWYEDVSDSYIQLDYDVSVLDGSSFYLAGILRVGAMGRSSVQTSNRYAYASRCDVLFDGKLMHTVYADSMDFDLGGAYFDFSSVVETISLRFYWDEPLVFSNLNPGDTVSNLWLYLSNISTGSVSADIGTKPYREGVLSGIGNIFREVLEIPGKIASLLIDGIKSLFVPNQDDMTSLTGKYQQLLSERLGFIWQAYELVSNLFTGILDALESGGAYEFCFPGISFPFNGEELILLPETPVSLENEVMDVIRPVLGTIVCFIAVVGFINVAEGMVMALISGVSYYEFLHGKKGGSG